MHSMEDTDSSKASSTLRQTTSRIAGRLWGIGQYTTDLEQRAARGGILVLITRLLIKVIQFSRTIVIARLLFPNDVGLFAVAAAMVGIAEMLIQPGLSSAVIRKDKIDRRHLDTAWTAILMRSIAIGTVAFAVAPLAASFIGTEALIPVIRALALAIAFNGLENIGAVLLVRDIRFNRKMLYDVSLVVAETVAIIIAAFVMQNVWALVIGVVVNKIAAVSISYLIHPYRPRLAFDMPAFMELFSFGKWIGITGIASYLIAQGDTLVSGRTLGTEATGFYALAFGLALMPAVEIARTLGTVLFPHLSRLPEAERGRAFLIMVRTVFLINIPATVGLAMIAEPLVRMVYGDKWLPMLAPFYILILYAATRTISYLIEPLYLSMGRPKVMTVAAYIHLLIMAIFIIPLGKIFGLQGIAGAVLLGSVVSVIYLLVGIRRGQDVRLRSFVRTAALPAAAATCMATGLFFFEKQYAIVTVPLLLATVLFGAVVYVGVLFSLDEYRGGSVRRSILWLKDNI